MVGIISNSAAMFAQRNLGIASAESESSIAKLSSGNRIIRASDDVAGLAVGTSLATTVSTLKTVLGTTNQASSLLQIADGGLKNIGDILSRQKALAVSANSGSLSNTERAFLQQEFSSLTTEINRIVDSTEFNGIKLLDGSVSGAAGLTTVTSSATGNYSLNAATDYRGTVNDTTALSVLDATTTTDASGFVTTDAVTFAVAQTDGTAAQSVINIASKTNGTELMIGNKSTSSITFSGATADTDTFVIGGVGGGVTFTFNTNGDNLSASTLEADSATNSAIAVANFVNSAAGQTALVGEYANGVTAVASGATVTFTDRQVGTTTNAITVVGSIGNGSVDVDGGGGVAALTLSVDNNAGDSEVFTFADVDDVYASTGANVIVIDQSVDSTAVIAAKIAAHLNDTSASGGGSLDGPNNYTYSASGSAITMTATAVGTDANDDIIDFIRGGSTNTAFGTVIEADETGGTLGVAIGNVTTPTYQADLQGSITNLNATYIAAGQGATNNSVQISATVGGVTYVTDVIDLSTGTADALDAASSLKFTSQGTNGTSDVTFSLVIGASDQTITDQATADTVIGNIQSELTAAGVSFGQSRLVSSFTEANTDGTALQGLTAAEVTIVANEFDTTGGFGSMEAFNVDRANNRITTTIGGEIYTADLSGTGLDVTGGNSAGYASNVITAGTGAQGAVIVFESASTTDARQLRIDLTSIAAATISFDSDEGEAAFESVLNDAFAIGGGAGLTFQVGNSATDSIGVTLSGANTSTIFVDGNGAAVTLDISTAGVADTSNGGDGTGSILASNVIDRAINSITGLRASVGALQSRFNFAASNISSAIQNTDAARSNFLDVDIAEESTNFATAQVRLQASISVLAQANQIPQNLLKLIG